MANNAPTFIKDISTCAICLDYYKDPRLLPCSHTYCYNCINQLTKSNQFTCPLNDGTIINAEGISKLPMNRTAKDMAEFLSSITQDYTSLKCGNCATNKCTYWCEKCDSYLCVTCSDNIHSQKILQNHAVVPSNQKPSSNICSDHPDEKLKLWCVTCEILVCRDCLLFKHKDHVYTSLQDIAQETKLKIKLSLQPIRENLEKTASKIHSIIEEQHQHYEATTLEIDETFQQLYTSLESRKIKLMEQLNEYRGKEKSLLERYQADINEQLKAIQAREALVQQIFNNNDSIQIMKMRKTLVDYDQTIDQQYHRIEQGCTFSKAGFNIGIDLKRIIDEYGTLKTEDIMLNPNGVQPKRNYISLNLSRPSVKNSTYQYEAQRGRGYLFQMQKPLKIRSVQLEASIHGQIAVYVVNNTGSVIKKESFISNDTTMKWTTIPIITELNTGYSILVWSPNTTGQFSYQEGDNNFRTVDQVCSIESKHADINHDLSIGEQLQLSLNSYSIRMIIDIEQ
ncbi:unnamed protein product [Rotaria magnacalcarata]|uniref:Uncharacterized protein n=4 Tax=Rotaria magnacalcarata TaxID=392030 RepID=A0A816RHV5_9BILA|nr:unnamed protein product [Rotaria magnacalcarata]CAF2070668.1 unnamed protein product [Rotaria magnacalcarata]CAF3924321.1 unnamed protein product [Rotaria magnacalcarata]CAF3984975.1 unnamed protein product [Rotaria magnacalcarata]